MEDIQKTLEVIFTEAVKVFGKDKSQSLLDKLFENTTTKVIETAVVETKKKSTKVEKKKSVKEETAKVDETEADKTETVKAEESKSTKRIGRMTKLYMSKLKASLIDQGVVFTDNEEKELESYKKKFTSYIEGLDNESFKNKKGGIEKHIEDFAKIHKPASTTTTTVSVEEEKSNEVSIPGPSNVAHIEDLTLKQLQDLDNIMTPNGGPKGVYWDLDKGRYVRGPDQEDDEDLTEKKFAGKIYGIGDKTGRIYEITDNKDIFVGFIGVGAFKDLKL
jgi:hypothetical protein